MEESLEKSSSKQHKSLWVFLAKFLGIYILGNIAYHFYLNYYGTNLDAYSCYITESTAQWLQFRLPNPELFFWPDEAKGSIVFNDTIIVNVIEGCNAISVMILFTAFVLSFHAKWYTYLLFLISGLTIIHLTNISRISLLGLVYVFKNQWFTEAHDYLFPSIIYGIVVVLWLIWIKFLAK